MSGPLPRSINTLPAAVTAALTDLMILRFFDNGTMIWSDRKITLQLLKDTIVGPNSMSSLSPYIVGPTFADYDDIQPAIDAAVLAGYGPGNPINIYVKPSPTQYPNSYTGANGINLVAFGTCYNPVAGEIENTVAISGSYAHPDGATSILEGFTFSNGGIDHGGGTLFLKNVEIPSGSITFSGETFKTLVLDNFKSYGSSAAFVPSGEDQNIQIIATQSSLLKTTDSSFNYIGSLLLMLQDCEFSNNFSFDNSTTDVSVIDSQCLASAGSAFKFNSTAAGSCYGRNFKCQDVPFGDFSSGNISIQFENCVGDWLNTSRGNSMSYALSKILQPAQGQEVFIAPRTGYRGSDSYKQQTYVTTSDDTPTLLASIELLENESCTMSGTVNAALEDHTDVCGGDFMIVCGRESGQDGFIVGSPNIRMNSTTTAKFEFVLDTVSEPNYMNIMVTGLSGSNYNWTSPFEFVKMVSVL